MEIVDARGFSPLTIPLTGNTAAAVIPQSMRLHRVTRQLASSTAPSRASCSSI